MSPRLKATAQDYPLTLPQLLELDGGPADQGSAFADEDDLRAAWEANAERILHRYAFDLHDAGWRPEVFWWMTGETNLGPAEDWREDARLQEPRIRYLLERDLFLPGELEQMERRAVEGLARARELARSLRWPDAPGPVTDEELARVEKGYAVEAWAIVQKIRAGV